MSEMRYCRVCGKELGSGMFDAYQFRDDTKDWGDPDKLYYLCAKHCNEQRQAEMKERILSGEESNPYGDQIGTDGFYCPYCGEFMEPDCEDTELYLDGVHDVACYSCGKTFRLNTYVSYSFDTEKLD